MSKEKKIVSGAPAKKKNNTLSLFRSRRLSTSGKEPDHMIKSDSFDFNTPNEGETVDGSLSKKNGVPSKAMEVGPRSVGASLENSDVKNKQTKNIPERPPSPKSSNSFGKWLLPRQKENSGIEPAEAARLSIASSTGRLSTGGRKSSLRMDEAAPTMLSHLDKQLPEALITMLDEPCLSGTGTLASERRTPAYAVALQANEDAILSLSTILGEEHPDVIQRKIHTADLYKGLGMLREASDLLLDVVECQKRMDDLEGSVKAITMNDLAMVYSTMKKHNEAEAVLDDVIKLLSKAYEGVHPDVAVAFGNMAVCLRNTFQYGRAIPLHERAVKVMSAVLSKDSPETVYQKAQLGVTLIRSGDRNRGQPILMEALGQMEKLGYSSNHLWVKTFRNEVP